MVKWLVLPTNSNVIVPPDSPNVLLIRNASNQNWPLIYAHQSFKTHAATPTSPLSVPMDHAERVPNNVLLNPDVLPDSLFAPTKHVQINAKILNSSNVPPIKCSNAKIKLVFQTLFSAEPESLAVTLI